MLILKNYEIYLIPMFYQEAERWLWKVERDPWIDIKQIRLDIESSRKNRNKKVIACI